MATKQLVRICGKISNHIHKNNWYLIKDLTMNGQDVYLKINRRRFKFKNGSPKVVEPLSYCQENRNYTKRRRKLSVNSSRVTLKVLR